MADSMSLISLCRRSPSALRDNHVIADDTARVPLSPPSCTARALSRPAGCARFLPQFLAPCSFLHEDDNGRSTSQGTGRASRVCSSPRSVRPWSSLRPDSRFSATRGSFRLPYLLRRGSHGSHNRLPSLMNVHMFNDEVLLACPALQFLHGFNLLDEEPHQAGRMKYAGVNHRKVLAFRCGAPCDRIEHGHDSGSRAICSTRTSRQPASRVAAPSLAGKSST